ncbi:hypothetical protein ACRRTK_020064 [Alexandromys fortis]
MTDRGDECGLGDRDEGDYKYPGLEEPLAGSAACYSARAAVLPLQVLLKRWRRRRSTGSGADHHVGHCRADIDAGEAEAGADDVVCESGTAAKDDICASAEAYGGGENGANEGVPGCRRRRGRGRRPVQVRSAFVA